MSAKPIEPWRRRLLEAGLFYAAMIWGATFFVVKALVSHIHPLALVGYRFLLSAALLAPAAARRRRPAVLLREGIVLGALLMLLYVSQTAGLVFTTASNSGFITGLFILFVPVLLLFSDKKPGAGQWAAVSLALGGLWMLTGGPRGFNKGDALTLIAAFAYAAHLLATDRYVRTDADPLLLAFHQFWFCGAACILLAWALGLPLGVGDARSAWTIVFLALFPNLSAFYIQLLAQKHVPPIKVSLIFSLEPVFAALFAWTLGHESVTAGRAAGGLLIVAAMVAGELSRLDLIRGRRREVLPT
ncbi:MAG TPA: DMT family transporter [Elusimicrobiota bacterium]|nr:DMT family transporter [Elusimicrobiota bacterium]